MKLSELKTQKKTKSDFDLFVEKVLLEMPVRAQGNIEYIDSQKQSIEHGKYILDTWKHLEDTTIQNIPVKVYAEDGFGGDPDVSLAFMNMDDQIIARVEYNYVEENSIEMSFIWQFRHYKEFMTHVFTEYLLPAYDAVISDNTQTVLGFKFYQKLFYVIPANEYTFSILDEGTNQEIPVNSSEELTQFFGDHQDYANYRFKIAKK